MRPPRFGVTEAYSEAQLTETRERASQALGERRHTDDVLRALDALQMRRRLEARMLLAHARIVRLRRRRYPPPNARP